VDLDELVDHGSAAPAASARTAGLPNLVPASGTGVDAPANHLIADRVAVANQHAFFI
jgi:hypothetical protein